VWDSTTPRAAPVEPDVNRVTAASAGRSASAITAAWRAVSSAVSRWWIIAIGRRASSAA